MSLYFTSKIVGDAKPLPGLVQCHPSIPLVATAWSSNRVIITTDDGERLSVITRTTNATSIAWHPVHPILVVGWRDGQMTLWQDPSRLDRSGRGAALAANEGDTLKAPEHDSLAVVSLCWTSGGNVLLSASKSCAVVIWQLESSAGGKAADAEDKQVQHRLVPAWTSKSDMPVTSATHLSSTTGTAGATGALGESVRPGMAAARKSNTGLSRGDDEIAFVLLAGNNSVVYLLDDSQKVSCLISHDKDLIISFIAWDCYRRKLFSLSTTNVMSLYSIDDELKTTAIITKRKISVGQDADLVMLRACWGPGNVIALSAGECLIRFFDIEQETMYSLRLPEIEGGAAAAAAAAASKSAQATGDDLAATVAAATAAKRINNNVSSLVSFTNVNNNAPSSRVSCTLSDSVLAAGTTNGKVFLWRYIGRRKTGASQSTVAHTDEGRAAVDAAEEADTEDSWVPMATLDVEGGSVESLRVLATGALAATTADTVSVLQEAFRRRKWFAPAGVVQATPECVVVSLCTTTTSATPASGDSAGAPTAAPGVQGETAISSYSATNIVVKTQTGKVREADLAFPQLALWNGQKLDVYTITESTGTTSLLHSNDYHSPVMALHTDGIFKLSRENPSRVLFENYSQHPISNMNFAEAEGVPRNIDCCGDFLCIVTNKNCMKVARIGARELRQLGPCRVLFPDTKGVTIRSCKVSPKGKMVALLVSHVIPPTPTPSKDPVATALNVSSTNASPIKPQQPPLTGDLSTKVFVYDLDTDKMKWYDFGVHHDTPEAIYWNSPTGGASQGVTALGGGATQQLDLEGLLLAVETKAQLSSLTLVNKRSSVAALPTLNETTTTTGNEENTSGQADGGEIPDGANATVEEEALNPQPLENGSSSSQLQQRRCAVTLFVAPGVGGLVHQPGSGGLVLHHSAPMRREQVCLIGCSVPFLLFSTTVTPPPSQAPAATPADGSQNPPSGAREAVKIAANSVSPPQDYRVERVKMRDFQGMGVQAETDRQLRDALMRFGYYATIGSMDDAYRAIKAVKDTSVWRNLAKMCVATKRLDVAEVCLANMQDGVAARMLRESKSEPELETRLGILALSVGMTDEAVELFKAAKRPDMITKLLLAANRWDDAQAHTQANDHIRIFAVTYQRAQFIEMNNLGLEVALKYYEKAQCAGSDVPRVLMQAGQMDELKARVTAAKKRLVDLNEKEGYRIDTGVVGESTAGLGKAGPLTGAAVVAALKGETVEDVNANRNARDLLVWWAQYLESTGDVANALQFYEIARDVFNVTRILCVQQPPKLEQAIQIVSNPMNREHIGAAYFIGRHYEDQGNSHRALQYLNMAGATKRAVRLAKTAELYNDVVAIVLQSNDKALAVECAKYFDDRGMYDRAAQLYQKGGDTQRAIDVCIKGGLFDQLHQISESLDSAADPETFISMAEHFINSKHYEKAVQMLVFAKAYNEALQLCYDKEVKLTDEIAEAMTLPKSDVPEEEEYRMALLKRIANVAKDQGSFHLACKKFTQAGERVKALKMLLKAGDTEKVIFFANHSRNAEIYVLAANYLQSQKWQTDANIYKTIVTFYTKAKNFESLALFYDSCAQLQIDEYRDYDKALATLQEALKVLDKSDISPSKKQNFALRVQVVEQFVTARRLIQPGRESPETVSSCQDLLVRSRAGHMDHDLIDSAIRIGDVYALLVEYYEKLGKFEEAYVAIEQMRAQEIELSYYLEAGLVEKVCKKVGRDPAPLLAPIAGGTHSNLQMSGAGQADDDVVEDGEFVEEV